MLSASILSKSLIIYIGTCICISIEICVGIDLCIYVGVEDNIGIWIFIGIKISRFITILRIDILTIESLSITRDKSVEGHSIKEKKFQRDEQKSIRVMNTNKQSYIPFLPFTSTV